MGLCFKNIFTVNFIIKLLFALICISYAKSTPIMATIVTTDHLKDCFETTIIDGKQWYICGVDPEECDTTATTEEAIRHHLSQSHGVVDISGPPIDHQIDEQMDTKSETPDNHRHHRSGRVLAELTSDDSNDTSSDESMD
jgi:hypothetical protein